LDNFVFLYKKKNTKSKNTESGARPGGGREQTRDTGELASQKITSVWKDAGETS
jgi:hypothetical protein